MKRSKIFRNILTVAVAASMIAGCFAFTGCDDKKDDEKDDKKSEKVEDEEEEEEDETTTTTEATEEETEATEEETEATEEEVEGDIIDIEEEPSIETVDASAFEDDMVKELAQKYLDKGLLIADIKDIPYMTGGYEGLVEGFMADSGSEVEISVEASVDENGSESEASGMGKMETAIVLKFETADQAADMFAQSTDGLAESFEGDPEIIDDDTVSSIKVTDVGVEIYICYHKDTNIVEDYLFYDLDALFAAMG